MISACVLMVAYWAFPHERVARSTYGWWIGGCVAMGVAFSAPVDDVAHRSLVGHMVQHLLLIFVAAPALAMGRPVTRWLALRIPRRAVPQGAAVVFGTTLGLIGVLYLTHLPSVYDAALRHEWLHALEHGAYLGAGIGFWVAVAQVDPVPRRAGHGQRLACLLALAPATALLAAAIGASDRILYPAQQGSLADQRAGAALMWITPMAAILPTALVMVLDWAGHEERLERRVPIEARHRAVR